MDVTLGLDLGTSGVRVLAVNNRGQVVSEVNRHYPLLTPQSGWTEQDPADWQRESLAALADMVAKLDGAKILALGLSGQMHGMVPLDEAGKVIRPAILWNDQRTATAVAEIEKAIARSEMIARTGNPAITGFQLPKLIWLREAEPEAYARVRHVLLPKDYIGYVLTGTMVAEPADASGTNCFHLASKSWDEITLKALDLDPEIYPQVIASDAVVGHVRAEIAKETGLPRDLAVIAGGGDNAAAAIGLGLSKANLKRGSVSLGTSGVIFMPLEHPTPDPEGRAHLFAHADGGYNLLGVTLAAAGSLQWFRDTLAPGVAFTQLMNEASESPIGAAGLTFKPYLAGERTPHMNPDLRASWTGLSLASRRADMLRAIMEGVAFSLRDALEVMLPLAQCEEYLVTGGGTASDLWLQIVADVLQAPLLRPEQNQGAAYGAALLAFQGVAQGEALDLAQQAVEARIEPGGFEPYAEAWERYLG